MLGRMESPAVNAALDTMTADATGYRAQAAAIPEGAENGEAQRWYLRGAAEGLVRAMSILEDAARPVLRVVGSEVGS